MPLTASMTTAGLTGVTICQAVLREAKKGGALLGKLSAAKQSGLAWMLHEFSVRTNKNNGRHYHYYLYGLERACEINQIALLGDRDWYFEGATILVESQNRRGSFRGAELPQTCFAIPFLKQSAPPLPAITGRR